jgi:excisionase family DNA binding protein
MATTSTDDFLTLFEASKLLQVSEKTLAAQAKAGQVPHCRVGKQFRFVRGELLNWARRQKQTDDEFNKELSDMVNRSFRK